MSDLLIDLQNISYRYPRRGQVLDNVDFQLREGERIGLIGPNGAGKTTLMHLIVGLLKKQQGVINAFGQVCEEEKDFVPVRAQAGLLFQDPDDQLFCPTVLEDVAFGPLNLGKSREEAVAIAQSTLQCLGMAGFEERVTHQLSGGEKRMITLATVLAMEPKVLLLDEPTNALDTKAKARLLETLKSLPQAMLIISHEHEFLSELCNHQVILDQGKLVSK